VNVNIIKVSWIILGISLRDKRLEPYPRIPYIAMSDDKLATGARLAQEFFGAELLQKIGADAVCLTAKTPSWI
jgi:hypothetical protein